MLLLNAQVMIENLIGLDMHIFFEFTKSKIKLHEIIDNQKRFNI